MIIEFLQQADVNPGSRAIYQKCIRYFFSWMVRTGRKPASTTRADIIDYKTELLEVKKLSTHSVALYMAVLKQYFKYVERVGFFKSDPTLGVRIPRRTAKVQKYPIDLQLLKELADHIGSNTPEARRDQAIIFLGFSLGLRNIEISRLTLGDITINGGEVQAKVKGKGSKYTPVQMVIPSHTWKLICEYFKKDRPFNKPLAELISKSELRDTPLFTRFKRKKHIKEATLQPGSISIIISGRLRAFGLGPNYTAHSLRHGLAFHLLKLNLDLHSIKRIMRHHSISTTQLYLISVEDELPLETEKYLLALK